MLYVHLQTKTTRSVCTSKRFVEGPREIQISLRLQGRHERHNIALTAFNFAYASRSNRSIVSRQRFVSPNPEMAAVRHLRLQHDSRGGGTRGWWQIRPIENLPLHTRNIGGDDPRQARIDPPFRGLALSAEDAPRSAPSRLSSLRAEHEPVLFGVCSSRAPPEEAKVVERQSSIYTIFMKVLS